MAVGLVPSGFACLIGAFLTGVGLAPDAAPVDALAGEALLTGALEGPLFAAEVDDVTGFFVPIGVRVVVCDAPLNGVLEAVTGVFLTGVIEDAPDIAGVDLVEAAGIAFFVPIGVRVGVGSAGVGVVAGVFFTAGLAVDAGFLTGVAFGAVVDLAGVVGFFAACEAPWLILEIFATLDCIAAFCFLSSSTGDMFKRALMSWSDEESSVGPNNYQWG